ncbi:helix-turn-helix transcriptional regulator [Kribbella sp. NBC_01505]|uniref:winged helix-turn-helix transcriptional regulator n=1 Tax=Kribbella sp. NBC_01505 TaxID=2903580 RepID=UPI00386990B8
MTLPSTYADRNCSLARALAVVGERWTLMILRDAFFGVRRFGDFATQLGIPRAVLTSRLKLLVAEGVMTRSDGQYLLTDKGIALWPVLRSLIGWGDEFYSPTGVKRALLHDKDGGVVDPAGRCETCRKIVKVPDIRVEPGPGYEPGAAELDPVSQALNTPHRLLEATTS